MVTHRPCPVFTTRQPSHQPGHPFAAQQLRALAEEFDAQAAATAHLVTQSVLRNCAEQARGHADRLAAMN
jgi:hypothetical protein